jgi:hypothetical protein
MLSVECRVVDEKRYGMRVHCVASTVEDVLNVSEGNMGEYQCEWEGVWGEGRTLRLPELTL